VETNQPPRYQACPSGLHPLWRRVQFFTRDRQTVLRCDRSALERTGSTLDHPLPEMNGSGPGNRRKQSLTVEKNVRGYESRRNALVLRRQLLESDYRPLYIVTMVHVGVRRCTGRWQRCRFHDHTRCDTRPRVGRYSPPTTGRKTRRQTAKPDNTKQ